MIPAIANAVIVPPLLALLASGVVVAVLIRSGVAALALDYPNQRSLHVTPTPRVGGIGIAAGVAAAWCYAAPDLDPLLLLALALLGGVSLLDDVNGVRIVWRLVIHLVSALLAATVTLRGDAWWVIAVAALAIAWMINLYNFMDGADGLAGGMTVFGFGSYGIAALAGGDFSFAALNLSVAAAALGFLIFNFPPARVFMGDVGTIPLGCLAAVSAIAGSLRGDWPWWFGILVFSPFIVDASVTLLKRLLRGARVWQAHREHYYQRLVKGGWGHRKTACAEYALMLICSLAAIMGTRMSGAGQLALLTAMAIMYAGLIIALEHHFSGHATRHADT